MATASHFTKGTLVVTTFWDIYICRQPALLPQLTHVTPMAMSYQVINSCSDKSWTNHWVWIVWLGNKTKCSWDILQITLYLQIVSLTKGLPKLLQRRVSKYQPIYTDARVRMHMAPVDCGSRILCQMCLWVELPPWNMAGDVDMAVLNAREVSPSKLVSTAIPCQQYVPCQSPLEGRNYQYM